MYQTFETERLLLKPTTEEDASFLLELLNTPKWIQNIGDRNIRSIEDAKNYIADRITPQFEKSGYSNYTVMRKSDSSKIGCCGIYDREGVEGLDIGFAFLPQYEKKGYAYESSNKIKQIAIDLFKIKKMSAVTLPQNIPSQKLLEKLGFIFIKIINIPNDPEDLMLYELETL